MAVSVPEEIKCRADVVPVRDKSCEDAVQVFGLGFAVESKHCVEGFKGPIRHFGFIIDFDQRRKEGRGNGTGTTRFEADEEVFYKGEMICLRKFEDEDMVGGVREVETGLAGGKVEDLFCEKRIRLSCNKLLDPRWRSNLRIETVFWL